MYEPPHEPRNRYLQNENKIVTEYCLGEREY